MNKLQNVLNDEESMNQIKELANMLTAGMPANTAEPFHQNVSDNAANNAAAPQNNPAPDLSALLNGLGLGGGNAQQSSAPQNTNSLPDFDISKLMQIGQVVQNASKPDKNIDLLLALRPLLKEENQVKIDRLVKIFKLFAIYPALKESGLLGGDLFGVL